MARKKTTSEVSMTIKPAPKFGPAARKIKRDFLKRRQAERDARALMIIEKPKPASKPKKKSTTKRKTTSTGVSPTCSRAGRRLKLVRSSSAGRTLSSPTCKTGAKKTTAKKRTTTTAKKRTSSVKSVISPITKSATRKTATRKTTTKKVTAKRTARRSTAVSKLARIKKIVC